MRKVRNITVAVTPELHRQTRRLAAEMDTTVTALVAYLLERMPAALKAAGYPVTVPATPSPSQARNRQPIASPFPSTPLPSLFL